MDYNNVTRSALKKKEKNPESALVPLLRGVQSTEGDRKC